MRVNALEDPFLSGRHVLLSGTITKPCGPMGERLRQDLISSTQDVESKDLSSIGRAIIVQFDILLNRKDDSVDGRLKLQHEYERFSLWTDNLGLLHRGHSSLDYRLREADNLRSFIRGLLEDSLNSLDQRAYDDLLRGLC